MKNSLLVLAMILGAKSVIVGGEEGSIGGAEGDGGGLLYITGGEKGGSLDKT